MMGSNSMRAPRLMAGRTLSSTPSLPDPDAETPSLAARDVEVFVVTIAHELAVAARLASALA